MTEQDAVSSLCHFAPHPHPREHLPPQAWSSDWDLAAYFCSTGVVFRCDFEDGQGVEVECVQVVETRNVPILHVRRLTDGVTLTLPISGDLGLRNNLPDRALKELATRQPEWIAQSTCEPAQWDSF